MKKKINKIVLVISIILLSSCGFKIVKYDLDKKFNLIRFNQTGDINVNNIIKSNINNLSKKNNDQKVELDIKTNIQRLVKEKNINNEIIKYELLIISEVEILLVNENKSSKFVIKEKRDFKNLNQINKLKYKERLIKERLAVTISNKILNEISSIINDL